MAQRVPAAVLPRDKDVDQIVILSGATWADFERMLAMRGDHGGLRFTYLEGMLEIMSPSRSHEAIKSIVGCLVEVYCLENDIVFGTFGSWTLKNPAADRGAEPDECYVFGGEKDPKSPDLAIEVEWTSGRIDKLDVYRKLGVAEVWYWREGKLTPYVLRGTKYARVKKSKALPGIDLEEVARFVDSETTSHAMRAYRSALVKRAKRR